MGYGPEEKGGIGEIRYFMDWLLLDRRPRRITEILSKHAHTGLGKPTGGWPGKRC